MMEPNATGTNDKNNGCLPLQGMIHLLEATKNEYEYLQRARNSLHTRVGILITLLLALVSATLVKDMPSLIEQFKSNIAIAHLRIISLIALLISFIAALISYIRIFFTHKYYVFPFHNYTDYSIVEMTDYDDAELIMFIYREYAECIDYNQIQFDKSVSCYRLGNKWLIVTIIFAAISIIISII